MDGIAATKRIEIYGLYDPDTDQLRYIGKANHMKMAAAEHPHIYGCWANI